MASVVMTWVTGLLLGQTYHLGKDQPGLQIFPTNVQENAVKMEQYFTDTQYRLIEDKEEMKDFLDISGSLSLRIKAGMISASGEGSYAKKCSNGEKSVQIVIKVHFETVTYCIPFDVKPQEDWINFNKDFLGTHYVRCMTYGGDLIASLDIIVTNTFDLDRLRGALDVGITTKGGAFEGSMKAKMEKVRNETQDSSSIEINYYATVPIEGMPRNAQELLDLVREFPSHVKKYNNGLGNPLRIELYPLRALEPTFKQYLENHVIAENVTDMESHLDDIIAARKALSLFVSGFPTEAPQGVKTKIKKFTDKLNNIYGIFLESISQLDTSVGASTKPIIDALEAYRDGGYSMPKKYSRMLRKLKQDIYKEAPELKPRIGGAQYNQWGRSKCEGPGTETSFSGLIVASQINQNGGSNNFMCSPFNPKISDPKRYLPDFDPEDIDQKYENIFVSPLKYMGSLKQYSSLQFKHIACSVCRVPQRTATLVKPGDIKCPEKWTKEYVGVLMAPGIDEAKGEYICMSNNMQEAKGNLTFGTNEGPNVFNIQEVSTRCGGLPCGPYVKDKAVPCVVCTI